MEWENREHTILLVRKGCQIQLGQSLGDFRRDGGTANFRDSRSKRVSKSVYYYPGACDSEK